MNGNNGTSQAIMKHLITTMPVQEQASTCMALLCAIAMANKDNPEVTKHGFKVGDDPLDTIISFLQSMKSAIGTGEATVEFTNL